MNHSYCLTVTCTNVFLCVCICRSMTPVYPLMETTVAAVWSWLTLSARRPSSLTETKLLPSRDKKRETLLDSPLLPPPCCCCLFYICGKYSETTTLYCIWQTQWTTWKKSDVNRHYLLWECTRIFFWCTFSTKGLIVIKGFYCLYKIQSICGFVSLQWLDGECTVDVATWNLL